jgi:arylsulfatase A-like enzyme
MNLTVYLKDWRQRTLLVFVAIFVSTAALYAQTNKPAALPRLPSIVFILADDLGYGDLGCYGQEKIKTPNIDKLASEGMRFTCCYAGSTVCAPSRAALMTGKHTGHIAIRGNATISLSAADVTFAQLLKTANYNTALIGKWGLGDVGSTGLPGSKGFDESVAFLDQTAAHNYYPTSLYRRSAADGREQMSTIYENLDGKKGKYVQDIFTSAALNYIRINAPDQFNHYRPFFLYLAYTIPHANDELGQKTGNGMEVPNDAPYSSESWPQVEKNKAAMITRLDADVGQVMDKLKAMKIDKNTIVIFASDNGAHKEGGVHPEFFHSTGPLRGVKRDLYEGGIRIPMIVRWPFWIKPGTTSDLPCAFWDFLPTLAEIARVKQPNDLDGISFLPTLKGETQTNRHEFLYWEFHEGGFKQAVRMGDWKAVRFGVDGPVELYDLKTDIGEKDNVAEKHPDVVAKIAEYLKTARTPDDRWPALTVAENEKLKNRKKGGSDGKENPASK